MRRLPGSVAAAVLTLVLAGCSSEGGTTTSAGLTTSAPASTTTSTTRAFSAAGQTDGVGTGTPVTSSPASVATTAPPAAVATSPLDWDRARFDFGFIKAFEEGGTVLAFDRASLYDRDAKLRAGPELTEEPLVYGNTDVPYVNENPKLRRYRLAAGAEVLALGNASATCASLENPAAPRWDVRSRGEMPALNRELSMVSLTFTPEGLVQRVRFSGAC